MVSASTLPYNWISYIKKYLKGVGFEPTNTRMYPDLNGAPLTTWLPYLQYNPGCYNGQYQAPVICPRYLLIL